MRLNWGEEHKEIEVKKFNFPCGEMHIQIKNWPITGDEFDQEFEFKKNEDIIELFLKVDAMKRLGMTLRTLTIPYVPFSRQDRVNVKGECFSLAVFADFINSLGAKKVVVVDPHSDVTPALIKNCAVVHQHEIFAPMFKDKNDFFLISPDGGALKKIYKLAALVDSIGVIECSKNRNVKTGEITGVKVYTDGRNMAGVDCYIVDDICDGGRTFIEIAKELKKLNCGKIILMVTHGFFTKGLEVFDDLIDEIYTLKGKIK